MTPDEHRALRKGVLDMSTDVEARLLGANPRTVQRWETGEQDISRLAVRLLRLLALEREQGPVHVRDALIAIAAEERYRDATTIRDDARDREALLAAPPVLRLLPHPDENEEGKDDD